MRGHQSFEATKETKKQAIKISNFFKGNHEKIKKGVVSDNLFYRLWGK